MKHMITRAGASMAAVAASALPFATFAQSDDYAEAGGAVAVVLIGGLFLVMFVVGLLTTIFWIWMLVDSIKRDYENKGLWIVLIIVFGFIPAVVYYFVVRKPAMKMVGGAQSQSQSQQPQAPTSQM